MRVDPRLTASALAHLLENAAQYTPPGRPMRVDAVVDAARADADACAIGARASRPQDLPHLFERFYRGAEATVRASGTGMGLSIARGLLAAERGRISAENCPDGGARFTIVVPAETRARWPWSRTA